MRDCCRLGFSAAMALFLATPLLRGDCQPAIVPISSVGVFPNRPAGPLATNGSIVGLARTASDATNAVYFAAFNPDLTPIGGDVPAAATTLNGATALLWTGSEFDLFYQAPSLTLMLQRIDASGNAIGAPIAIANHAWSPGDEFDVAWVPARKAYAIGRTVTIGADRGVWLSIISSTGTVLFDSSAPVFLGSPTLPHVLGLADGTVAMTAARTGSLPSLTLILLSPSNSMVPVLVSEQSIVDLRMATDGSSVLIIDAVATASGGTTLRYAQVSGSGKILASDAAFLAGSGIDIVPRSLIWNAALSEWALVYVDAPIGLLVFPGDTRFRRFGAPTGLASDTFLAPDATYSRLASPFPPIFLSSAYIASIEGNPSAGIGSESYVLRSCPFFVTATADHPIWAPYLPITFTAHPSGGLPAYAYAWDFGDLSTKTGAVVQHAYNLPGAYTITLTATDAAGAQSVYKFTVTVAFLRHRAAR